MNNNYVFEFYSNEESNFFCENIISKMIRLYGINRNEAIGRINRFWRGNDFVDEEDIRYHETEDFWAHEIYYGHDSFWWTNPPNLKPLSYP